MSLAAVAFALAVAQAGAPLAQTRPAQQVSLRVEAGADGNPVAFREGDPSPLRGVDIYRAVLRLDLVDHHDRTRILKRALLVGGAVALVGGPVLGYVFGEAAARPTYNCWILGEDGQPMPECRPNPAIVRENDRTLRRGVIIGSGLGAALSAVLFTAGLSVHPHEPDLAEAQELAGRFNARLQQASAAPRAELRLAPTDGGGWVGVTGRF